MGLCSSKKRKILIMASSYPIPSFDLSKQTSKNWEKKKQSDDTFERIPELTHVGYFWIIDYNGIWLLPFLDFSRLLSEVAEGIILHFAF